MTDDVIAIYLYLIKMWGNNRLEKHLVFLGGGGG